MTTSEFKSLRLPSALRLLRRLPLPHKLGLLERLYGPRLAGEGTAWVEASNGVVWKLDLSDACERWIVYGDYEDPEQMGWLRRWLNRGGVVIDSGANIGQMALYLAPLPEVELFAFEPLPSAADWLEECLARHPEWSVKVIRKGLSSADDAVVMQVDGARSTARTDWYERKHFPTLSLPMTTLDSFLEENRIPVVKLWKLDVEGHELQALEGAHRYLERQGVAAILVELSGGAEPRRLLADCGYALYRFGRRGGLVPVRGADTALGNLLALPVGSAS